MRTIANWIILGPVSSMIENRMFQAVLGHPHDDLVDGRSHEKLASKSCANGQQFR